MTPSGTLTTLGSFGAGSGARFPYGRLLQASDGNFYGVAAGQSVGRIFRLSSNGTLTTFVDFDGYNGADPIGGLVQAWDGNLYGTAAQGGTNPDWTQNGTVYQVSLGGALSLIAQFSGSGGPYPGAAPYAGLLVGSDGNLYGTTGTQGSRGNGNVFRIIMPGPLLISRRAGQQLTLSWRTNYTGFTLQSSESLNAPNWVDSTNPAAVSKGYFWVTNPISSGAQFFRLKK
jgi:uncharacterized repeat protein (TIGR03803 family)